MTLLGVVEELSSGSGMAEQDLQGSQGQAESVGERLRLARAAAGLSRADVAARTKIAERHLIAIESDNFGDLASSTYAVGFSRAYARAVGLDEVEIARAVRTQMGALEDTGERSAVATFEPGDPARIPGSRTAWLAAIGAVAVIAAVFMFWGSYYAPAVSLPDLAKPPSDAPSVAATAPPTAVPAAQAPVVFTALEPGVWVKFYDAAGKQLMQKQMALGETYTVPADATGPLLRTARPDALRITVGGREVPRLAERQRSMADVPVSAAALLARAATPMVTSAPAPAPQLAAAAPTPEPAPVAAASSRPSSAPAPSPAPKSRGATPTEAPKAASSASAAPSAPASAPTQAAPVPVPAQVAPAEPSTVSQ